MVDKISSNTDRPGDLFPEYVDQHRQQQQQQYKHDLGRVMAKHKRCIRRSCDGFIINLFI